MRLHDFPYSPNCKKVRAVAYELDIPLDCVTVNLFDGARAPEFLAKNPNGRVPVLEDGDFVLW
ncbi:MAG: glutathione S-transferase N-terminal domain-containing protein, partial [Myxococcales bacterium]|nr:glutathione S-transferase N-terminal domain-containing protein [Myxococcales bacterium]